MLQAKSVALLLAGIMLISSVFVIFNVEYPSQPATLIISPPKNVTPPPEAIFANQSYNAPGVGENYTSFIPTANATSFMQGYAVVRNNSGTLRPLANQDLYIAVMEAAVMVKTNATGYYRIEVLKSGSGVFAFEAFQSNILYAKVFVPLNGPFWKNVTLVEAGRYSVSGTTVSTNGAISGVLLQFNGFLGSYKTSSNSSSAFSLNMVNGTYRINATKPGFSNVTVPVTIRVSGSDISNQNIELYPLSTPIFHINGTVENDLGQGIPNATVYSSTLKIAVRADGMGHYSIPADYGMNQIWYSNYQYVNTSKNLTVVKNMTFSPEIASKDPFFASSTNTSNVPFAPQSLNRSASTVDYGIHGSPAKTMSGRLVSEQTGQALSDQNFTAYTSVNGTYSFMAFTTGSTGSYVINFQYPGNYTLVITSALSLPFNLSSSSGQGGTTPVNTSGSSISSISGTVSNGNTGSGVSGVKIGISTSPGGGSVMNFTSNSTGNYSGRIISGKYYITYSKPGYENITVPVSVNGNITVPTVHLVPTDIGSNFTFWSVANGSGLPAVNGSSVSAQINSTFNSSSASTFSYVPAVLKLHLINGTADQPLSLVPLQVFLKTNGAFYLTKGTTTSTGNFTLYLDFSGTYVILPEMIQFHGQSQFINSSAGHANFIMTNYTLISMTFNLSNPLNYAGDGVPVSAMNVGNYSLPIYPRVPYSSNTSSANSSVFRYMLPAGIYNVSYRSSQYVPVYWNISLRGSYYNKTILKPYVAKIYGNSPINWYFVLSGITGSVSRENVPSGINSEIIQLTQGSFTFNAFINGSVANSSSFVINTSHYEEFISMTIAGHQTNFTTSSWTYNDTTEVYAAKYQMGSSLKGSFISSIRVLANTTPYLNVSIDGSASLSLSVSGHMVYLVNYFATGNNGQNTLNLVISQYNADDLQSVITNTTQINVQYYASILTED